MSNAVKFAVNFVNPQTSSGMAILRTCKDGGVRIARENLLITALSRYDKLLGIR